MSTPEHKALIWNLINDINVGMLITSDDNTGVMRGRPMHLVQDSYDGTLYFFTSKSAAKVDEVKDDEDVCITFSDAENQVYVTLSGTASITQDQDLINRYWNKGVESWYEAGREDPEVAILEIKINKGEHWNADSSSLVRGFKMLKANLKGEKPEMGVNETFG